MIEYQLRFKTQDEYRKLRGLIKNDIYKILGESDSFLMEIAINEAVNNALCSNSMKLITINIRVSSGKRLIIRIKDQGKGFNVCKALKGIANGPELLLEKRLSSDSGRGIPLIKLATDKMFYNRVGNELLLMKRIGSNLAKNIDSKRVEVFG
ncbi:ATP-binding protein [Cytobacillus sp. FJAT-53684]|uniref:ATP-binding protein n=1 Tax=Cytobacillus mangrovibacter TaxID=3299024 RepID=A0ABW6JZE9_9BACI